MDEYWSPLNTISRSRLMNYSVLRFFCGKLIVPFTCNCHMDDKFESFGVKTIQYALFHLGLHRWFATKINSDAQTFDWRHWNVLVRHARALKLKICYESDKMLLSSIASVFKTRKGSARAACHTLKQFLIRVTLVNGYACPRLRMGGVTNRHFFTAQSERRTSLVGTVVHTRVPTVFLSIVSDQRF